MPKTMAILGCIALWFGINFARNYEATPTMVLVKTEDVLLNLASDFTQDDYKSYADSMASTISSDYATDFDAYSGGITKIESGGKYQIVGPATKSGDHAYGRYQIMGNNIPRWTLEVLGKKMTPNEFLNDNNAQDQVFRAKSMQCYAQYGNWADCASMWFSGRPLRNNNAKDVTGTSVPKYVSIVLAEMNKRRSTEPSFSTSNNVNPRPKAYRLSDQEGAPYGKQSMQILVQHLKGLDCHPPSDMSGCGLGTAYELNDEIVGIVEIHAPSPTIPHKHPGLSLVWKNR